MSPSQKGLHIHNNNNQNVQHDLSTISPIQFTTVNDRNTTLNEDSLYKPSIKDVTILAGGDGPTAIATTQNSIHN